ncbi:MAG: GNAT family N-acetyltransferase [Deltaproteobacteria bacterium]|nr:GNAT family N-acetyltransferase [Deltaproteobacteria bacterium]
MRRRKISTLSFAEKDFYLDEFHEKSLLLVLRASDLSSETDGNAALEVFETLLKNETQLLFLIEAAETESEQRRVRSLYKYLARVAKVPSPSLVVLPTDGTEDDVLVPIWTVLRGSEVCIALWPPDSAVPLVTVAQRIAVSLRVYKVVFLDAAGGISTGGKSLSFMTGAVLRELLRPGEAEWAGLGSRRPLLEAICKVLEGGTSSVTLCPLTGLGRELFTYEGDGTLFTLTDYCQVEKLGIDDFREVEQLLQRGERDGYLKPRSPQETTLLLLHGYGARVGPAPGELAGFCALLPYPESCTAEIVGLSTITRYQGEGIGGRLVDQMVAEGEQQHLSYIFACTTQEGAQRLFERHGFRRVAPDEVTEEKWQDYNPERKQQVAVYRRDLPGANPQ